jgi:hypothetical protein
MSEIVDFDGGGMDRRSFLGSAGAVVLGSTPLAAGRTRPVVDWDWFGGFAGPGVDVLHASRLVAYPDGLVVADADRQSRLDGGSLRDLRRRMVTVLADPASIRRRPGAPVIADAPTARFAVRSADGTLYTVAVNALDESRPAHAYPQRLYRLSERLGAVHQRVLSSGTAYRPEAVRLVAVLDSTSAPSAAAPWPHGLSVPPIAPGGLTGQINLRGRPARAAIQQIPRRNWPLYRTVDGLLLRAAWRFLLPHE